MNNKLAKQQMEKYISDCPECGESKGRNRDGYQAVDPCLGKLPGVISACCGHETGEGYIIFENNTKISFTLKKVVKNALKVGNLKIVKRFSKCV